MYLGLAHSGVLAGPFEERARPMSARPLRGPVLGHFGTTDEFIPEPAAQELEAELRQARVDVGFEF